MAATIRTTRGPMSAAQKKAVSIRMKKFWAKKRREKALHAQSSNGHHSPLKETERKLAWRLTVYANDSQVGQVTLHTDKLVDETTLLGEMAKIMHMGELVHEYRIVREK